MVDSEEKSDFRYSLTFGWVTVRERGLQVGIKYTYTDETELKITEGFQHKNKIRLKQQ